MTTFLIKISGKTYSVFRNKTHEGKTDNYKQALFHIAETIREERIRNYEVFALFKGEKELLEDFNPNEILKDSSNSDDSEDDDDQNNRRSSDRFSNDDDDDFDHRRNHSRGPKGFTYTPQLTSSDYDKVAFNLKDALDNSRSISQDAKYE